MFLIIFGTVRFSNRPVCCSWNVDLETLSGFHPLPSSLLSTVCLPQRKKGLLSSDKNSFEVSYLSYNLCTSFEVVCFGRPET